VFQNKIEKTLNHIKGKLVNIQEQ